MITVIKSNNGFALSGHAGYAECGKDIVCAAISTLTETFIKAWDELADDVITVHYEAGNVNIEYNKERSDVAEALIRSFFIGIEGVREAYPDYVNVKDN